MKKRRSRIARDDLKSFFEIIILGIALTIGLYVIILPVHVSGDSMSDTLADGDLCLGLRIGASHAKRGDIVILERDGSDYVKRVIGTGGDVINIDYETDTVTVNGNVLEETYIAEHDMRDIGSAVQFPYTVPDDSVFVMGDNRNYSIDSRSEFGSFARDEIVARLMVRLFPSPKFMAPVPPAK